MTPLAIVKVEFARKLSKLNTEHLHHIYTSGSVARNEFYDNWSDVDINVVADSPLSFEQLSILNEVCRSIAARLGCKVGMDFISYQSVTRCYSRNATKQHIADSLEFVKNYHESNAEWLQKGTLFLSKATTLNTVPGQSFVGISIEGYLHNLEEQVYETLMRRPGSKDRTMHEVRIVTKACLYILQTYMLSKTGELITDYSKLPDAARSLTDTDTQLLETIYRSLQMGDTYTIFTNYDHYLEALFTIFNQLMRAVRTQASTQTK